MASKDTESVLKLMKDNDCDILDLKFIDVPGTWQHVALPISEVDDNLFSKGTGFDGSSVRGFQSIDQSDMLLLPHAETVWRARLARSVAAPGRLALRIDDIVVGVQALAGRGRGLERPDLFLIP